MGYSRNIQASGGKIARYQHRCFSAPKPVNRGFTVLLVQFCMQRGAVNAPVLQLDVMFSTCPRTAVNTRVFAGFSATRNRRRESILSRRSLWNTQWVMFPARTFPAGISIRSTSEFAGISEFKMLVCFSVNVAEQDTNCALSGISESSSATVSRISGERRRSTSSSTTSSIDRVENFLIRINSMIRDGPPTRISGFFFRDSI